MARDLKDCPRILVKVSTLEKAELHNYRFGAFTLKIVITGIDQRYSHWTNYAVESEEPIGRTLRPTSSPA